MNAGTKIDVRADLAHIFREEAGGLTGVLARRTGDFALAEECVQDALVRALERWPRDGIPDRPGAWLMTVARNRALDRLRRDRVERRTLVQLEPSARHPDDRLEAIFTCCHPALGREAQLALTLQAVCGFTTAQIAGALLCSEAAVAQRVSRARRKITGAKITFRSPEPEELDERLAEVLAVVYLIFNEGYLSAGGKQSSSRDLTEDAAWLGSLLVRLYPKEPEPVGLLALMWLHLARTRARFNADGKLVLLQDQDRSLWNRQLIDQAFHCWSEPAPCTAPARTSYRRRSQPAMPKHAASPIQTGRRFWRSTTYCWRSNLHPSSASIAPLSSRACTELKQRWPKWWRSPMHSMGITCSTPSEASYYTNWAIRSRRTRPDSAQRS